MGYKHGRFIGSDKETLRTSEQLLRLPLFYSLSIESAHYVTEAIHAFFTHDDSAP
jgi:dTDP-4-amino-4,6-dideoxygalactose transaminase